LLKTTYMDSGAIAYIRQHKPLGLGHAVWCARRLIGDEPFAVILPDDVIAADKPCLQQMVEAHAEVGGNMVAAMEVPPARTSAATASWTWPRTWARWFRCAGWWRSRSREPRRRTWR
jgi:UTP--glucose-1-phosphate uridylyltransferase